jgi:ElaB/YqjD/DUF883 family membrane-anchored ribosome-binding protein
MTKFQARYFDGQDETIPCRVDPVEAPDLATALEQARSEMRFGESRVELADLDDEFRRGTPNQDADVIGGVAEGGAAASLLEKASTVQEKLGEQAAMVQERLEQAAGLVQERYGEVREKASDAAVEIDRYVRAKPYVAVAVAAVLGYVIGLHLGAGDRKVIYLKDAR